LKYRIRPLYLFEKTVATFGTFALLYTVTETFILPYTNPGPDQSFARTLLDLALPFMLAYLLLFYIVFGAFDSILAQFCTWTSNDLLRMYMQRIRGTFIVSDSVGDYAPSYR
jgi:sterol O-acyltransferase